MGTWQTGAHPGQNILTGRVQSVGTRDADGSRRQICLECDYLNSVRRAGNGLEVKQALDIFRGDATLEKAFNLSNLSCVLCKTEARSYSRGLLEETVLQPVCYRICSLSSREWESPSVCLWTASSGGWDNPESRRKSTRLRSELGKPSALVSSPCQRRSPRPGSVSEETALCSSGV